MRPRIDGCIALMSKQWVLTNDAVLSPSVFGYVNCLFLECHRSDLMAGDRFEVEAGRIEHSDDARRAADGEAAVARASMIIRMELGFPLEG